MFFKPQVNTNGPDKIPSAFICVYLLTSAVASPTLAVNVVTNPDRSINASRYGLLARSPCRADLETLVDRLLQDLPSYANRVIVRSGFSRKTSTPPGYVLPQIIFAGRPEFEPLPLNSGEALS